MKGGRSLIQKSISTDEAQDGAEPRQDFQK